MTDDTESDPERVNDGDWGINRRNVLRSTAAFSAAGIVGVPAFSGGGLAATTAPIETCGDLDIVCAIDTSGSLNDSEVSDLEDGVNAFIDALPTDGSVTVGSLEFGDNGVRNKNDLQDPSGLDVTVSSPGRGNTPMPGGMDIADQAVYGDSAARSDAIKLVVLFTDGGPNYTNTSYSVGGYTAPRDTSDNWSATSGDSTYDNADTASSTVSKDEMDETALVAESIKAEGIGGGATLIATVYVGDDDTEAMTGNAITTYTNLPTYLEGNIASSSDFAIDVDISNIEGLVDQLVEILADLCCEDLTLDLCAGQDIDVGTVTVSESGGTLSITYDLNEPWLLCESHVDIGDEFEDLHTNGPGNPQVGQFDLSEPHECTDSFTYTVDCDSEALNDVDFSDGGTLYIAAHGVVRPVDGCADFSGFEVGESVEGLGTAIPTIGIESTSSVSGAEAVAQKEGEQPATYGAPNGSGSTPNGCLDDYHDDSGVSGGFSDLATKQAAAPHSYEFTAADDVTLSDFSLRMLDFGDFNPDRDTHHYAEMVAYDEDGNEVDRMELEYYTEANVNPTTAWDTAAHDNVVWDDLQEQGDACDAVSGEPGNWVWTVSGDGIVRIELTFGDGHDPNIAFTDLCFTAADETAWVCEDQDGVSRFVEQGNWATYFTYELCGPPGGLDCSNANG